MADNAVEGKPRPPSMKKGKGKFCCAGNCTNTYLDGVSLHSFPPADKRPDIRRKWIKFIRDEQVNFSSPSKWQFICEKHFTPDSYPMKYRYLKGMGKTIMRKDLNPDAVPTIHLKPPVPESSPCTSSTDARVVQDTKERRSIVSRKLSMSRMMNPAFHTKKESDDNNNIPTEDPDQNAGGAGEKEKETVPDTTCNGKLKDISCGTSKRSVGLQVRKRPTRRSKSIQTNLRPGSSSLGIQCNMSLCSEEERERGKVIYPRNYSSTSTACSNLPESKESDKIIYLEDDNTDYRDDQKDDDDDDVDFLPPSSPEEEDQDEEMIDDSDSGQSHWYDTNYLVYGSQLLELFAACPKCDGLCTIDTTRRGSMLSVVQECLCGWTRRWNSQPFIGSYPAGNLDISTGILFSGSIPSKSLRFLQHMNVQSITSRTFFYHQQDLLYPSILGVWQTFQTKYFATMRNSNLPLTLGGDGRCDTPGHSAKYGSYTILDVNYMVVADIQLVQSNEVKSSCHMEKEGLVRCMAKLKAEGLQVGELVTDRHPQISKYVREEMPTTRHFYDVWHVSKGLKKKLLKISNLRDCSTITPWIQSITNHLYWAPISTPSGEQQLILEKWLSLLNHITNVHDHSGQKFPKCLHGPIEDDRQKQWLAPYSKVFVELEKCLTSTRLKNDIKKLSTGPQTAALEGLHSVLNHFAPKMIGFSFEGMFSRLILSALHFNENMQRPQACTKDGDKRYAIVFPKAKAGDYSVKEVKVPCTYGYVQTLKEAVRSRARKEEATPIERPPIPAPLSSAYFHPDKTEAVNNMQSRYKLL